MENNNINENISLGQKLWIFILDTGQTFLIAGIIFGVIYFLLFRPFQVSGNSMYSSFQDKEYILTNLISLRFGNPKRGDVIVFKAPTEPSKDFIKRVIALPGDTLEIKNGYVYLNGKQLDESKYLDPGIKTQGGDFLYESVKITVPSDNYFVMGDNRSDSSDSRQWGLLNRNNTIGISLLVYWPPGHMHLIHNPYTLQ